MSHDLSSLPPILLCAEVWSDGLDCNRIVEAPDWVHDHGADHPRLWFCHESALRQEPVLAAGLPEEVAVDLWLDDGLVLGVGSFAKNEELLDDLLDADWDYRSLHPSRLVAALSRLEPDNPVLRRLAGLAPYDDAPDVAEVLTALWRIVESRAAVALGLAGRRDTPSWLLGEIVEWAVQVGASQREIDPMVFDALAGAAQGAPVEVVHAAVGSGCSGAAVALVARPEPLPVALAERCADLLLAESAGAPAEGVWDLPIAYEALCAWDALDGLIGRADCPPELVDRLLALAPDGGALRLAEALAAARRSRQPEEVGRRLGHWDPVVRLRVGSDPVIPSSGAWPLAASRGSTTLPPEGATWST